MKMGLPVCVSVKANHYIDFAHIIVTCPQCCVLKRLLLLKSQQAHECGHVRNTPYSWCEKKAAHGKIPVQGSMGALSSGSFRMTQAA